MNLSKQLKRKRDAEARLQKTSPTPVYVGTGGNPTTGGGTIINEEYTTIQNIINQITQVIQTQLVAGNNITITDNEDGTYTISTEAMVDLMFDGGDSENNDFTINFDGGEA